MRYSPHSHAPLSLRRYLEMSDWVLEDAIHAAWEDGEWEKEDARGTPPKQRGGEISIKVALKNGKPVGFCAQGAGDTVPYGKFENPNGKMASVASGVDMTIYEGVPTSVNKNVSPKDVYQVSDGMCEGCVNECGTNAVVSNTSHIWSFTRHLCLGCPST